MKNPTDRQSKKRALRLRKHLKRFIKPLPRYGKATNIIVVLAFVLLVLAGAAALTMYKKPAAIITNPTSSTAENSCLLSNSGCPDSKSSSTPAPTTTQPAQNTTPTTAATTTSPQSSSDSSTSDCTIKTLPPPPTTYEDTNSLPQGQTEQVTTGSNGVETICDGVPAVFQGAAPVVWVGTGKNTGSSSTEPTQTDTNQGNEQEYQQCMQNINSQLEADGASGNPDAEQQAEEVCNQYL